MKKKKKNKGKKVRGSVLVLSRQTRNTVIMLICSALLLGGFIYIAYLNEGHYTPGIYYDFATGKEDELWVEVTVSEDRIKGVRVLDNNEYDGISDPAKQIVPQHIVRYNTADVDSVSGATKTSNGIRVAVYKCLLQASGRNEIVTYSGTFPDEEKDTQSDPDAAPQTEDIE